MVKSWPSRFFKNLCQIGKYCNFLNFDCYQKEAISEVIIEVTNCNQSMCVLQVPSNDPEPNEHIERNEYTLKNVRNLNERNPSAPL